MKKLFTRRITFASIAGLSTTGLYYAYSKSQSTAAKMLLPYQATFCVPLSCESCVNDISSALSAVPGISSTTFSVPSQLVTTTGTAPPSAIISTIQSTGRPAILRGSGAANSAAVCILEIPPTANRPDPPGRSPIRGLARLIQLSPSLTLLDISLSSLSPGTYSASLRSTGDISSGASSMGDVYKDENGKRDGELGTVIVNEEGRGALVTEVGWRVWEMVGRGMLVRRVEPAQMGKGAERAVEGDEGRDEQQGENDMVVGVVARSAGAWENDKVVCACSGKTVWQEREEMVGKGIA